MPEPPTNEPYESQPAHSLKEKPPHTSPDPPTWFTAAVLATSIALLFLIFGARPSGPGCGRDQGQKLRTDLRSPARAAMIPSSDTPEVSGQCQGLQPAGTPILGPTQPGYGKTPN